MDDDDEDVLFDCSFVDDLFVCVVTAGVVVSTLDCCDNESTFVIVTCDMDRKN